MIPYNDRDGLTKADNPVLRAIRTCVEANGFVRRPVTPDLLEEVSTALTRATRCSCVAFLEVDLVPPAAGMVRVRLDHNSGPWVLTAFRSLATNQETTR